VREHLALALAEPLDDQRRRGPGQGLRQGRGRADQVGLEQLAMGLGQFGVAAQDLPQPGPLQDEGELDVLGRGQAQRALQ
jgi:hypothetical protein